MSVLVREIAAAEAARVGRLLVEWNEEHLAVFPPEIAGSYREELADVTGRLPTCDVLVAELAELPGEPVGTVTLVRDAADDGHPWPDGGAVVRLLAVDPAHRGRGVGSSLVELCISRAAESGATFVGLHTAPVMAAARRLYERFGFVRAPEHDFEPGAHYGSMAAAGGERWGLAYVLELPAGRPDP